MFYIYKLELNKPFSRASTATQHYYRYPGVIFGRAITCLDGIHETPLAAFAKSTEMHSAMLRNK